MSKNFQITLALVIMVACLAGCALLSVALQLSSWPRMVHLGRDVAAVLVLYTLGGAIAEVFLGRGKSRLSNLLGVVLILVLLGGSGMMVRSQIIGELKNMNAWEKTIRMIAVGFGGLMAVLLGRSIVQRIHKTRAA